ncbi:MAG: hypothetical protein GQ527_12980, partial [Bacteroidales bacterium]|nr:hypothetical protein [Bacteroidales bacterium]
SDNFPDQTNRNTAAVFFSYKVQLFQKKLNIVTSIREEMVDEKLETPTPALGFDWNPKKGLSFKAKLSRNYRSPTFNDLYWEGGFAHGNKDLLAESGWSEEVGIELQKKINNYHPSLQINAFNSNINDLIVWLPNDTGVWMPVNKKKVWSRGIEIQQFNDFSFQKINTGVKLFFTYNPSTLNTGTNQGKQLIYQPVNQAKMKYYFTYKYWTFDLIYQWFDERFITEDNSKSLNSYQLINLGIHGDILIKKQLFGIHIRVNNLLNEVYQSVEYYATPLRNFQLSIQYKINQR